ncbi:MAG: AMP-binding protein, partial [Desulfobacteraceae bacterium]|nr:AMP-binding protein [Desulfobacteraceae bacterium]
RELDERASQLAHYLQKTGSEHNPCVGICMEPCVESVVGMLGALKAGQIFVPLDPRVSAERLSFMLKYARVNLLLTREKYKSGLSEHSIQLLCLDHCLDHFENQPVPAAGELNLKENPWPEITPESPAYVFFTSDREGILADHRRVCQRLGQLQEQFALSDTDSMLVQAYPGQDSFIWETLWP